MSQPKVILRNKFVKALMDKGGFSFTQACRAFDCMTGVIADGVVTGSQMRLGKVGALLPVRTGSRECHMGFRRTKDGVEQVKRVFAIGPRLRYRFKVFDKFLEKNKLDWFEEE